MKTLTTLYNLYEVNRVSHPVFQNEAEFRSLYLLLHLASNTQVIVHLVIIIFKS